MKEMVDVQSTKHDEISGVCHGAVVEVVLLHLEPVALAGFIHGVDGLQHEPFQAFTQHSVHHVLQRDLSLKARRLTMKFTAKAHQLDREKMALRQHDLVLDRHEILLQQLAALRHGPEVRM